jgi:hypothetical protein
MTEQLWVATLTAAQLEEWLTPSRDKAPFAVLEKLTDIDFPAKEDVISPAEWQKGRIFGEAYELRWERCAENYRAWLAGEYTPPAPFTALELLDGANVKEVQCFLWGRSETRLTRPLHYQALPDGRGRVRLLCHGFHRADGALLYSRFVKMEWSDET